MTRILGDSGAGACNRAVANLSWSQPPPWTVRNARAAIPVAQGRVLRQKDNTRSSSLLSCRATTTPAPAASQNTPQMPIRPERESQSKTIRKVNTNVPRRIASNLGNTFDEAARTRPATPNNRQSNNGENQLIGNPTPVKPRWR